VTVTIEIEALKQA